MYTQLKMKSVLLLLFLSIAFVGCEKEIQEIDSTNIVGLEKRLQTSINPEDPFELRINSGGDEVTYGSEIFVADTYFTGNGKTYGNGSIIDIADTDRDAIYLSERSSQTTFGYAIPLENGTYTIVLHFAEIYWGATGGGQDGEGNRIFSVAMESNSILSNYDINQEVGAMTAVVKSYEVTVSDGELNLDFSASVDQPKIAAIEVLGEEQVIAPVDPTDAKVLLRINSGGGQVRDGEITFDADNYFDGGGAYTNNSIQDIANTELDEIYTSEHNSGSGSFSYEIPVVTGNYTVKLHFAEIYFGATGGGAGGTGKRVFNVDLEGNPILTDFDINQEVGAMTATIRTFDAFVNDGVINIDFVAGIDQPKLSGLEILSSDGEILKDACDWRNNLADANHNHIEGQTATVNGKLYLFGGFEPTSEDIGNPGTPLFFANNTEIYDPSTDTWSDGAPMPTALSHGGMQAVGDEIWIIGGFLGDNGGPGTDLVQIYDTNTDTWSTGPSIPVKSAAVAAVFVDGRIHIFGGYAENRETNLDNHYYYDTNNTTEGWQQLASLPVARGHHGGAVVDGIIYAIGGQDGHNTTNKGNIDNVEAYDFTTDQWTNVAPMLYPNSHFELSTLVHNGKVMLAGGNNGARDILQYDPGQNDWSRYCDGLPNAMLTPTMMIHEEKLIITCGGLGNNWNPTKETIWISAPN